MKRGAFYWSGRRSCTLPHVRFWKRVEKTETCWLWIGCRTRLGYGTFAHHSRRTVQAHRFAYELLVGPIPERLELDHLCANRACVNPDHLEPVTHLENVRRGWARRRAAAA